MQGVVQRLDQTKNGKPFVKIDGKDYFFGRDASRDVQAGQRIEFEYEEFGEARGRWGRPRALTRWKPVLNGAGKPETGSTITDADILRSVSNVVGSACAAGTVKSPQELEQWFMFAWAGFTRRQKSAQPSEPEFDDNIPYGDESENPAPREPSW